MAFIGGNKNDTPGTTGSVTKPVGTVDGHLIALWAITDSATGTVTWPAGFVETSVTPLRTSTTDASSLFVATKIASGEGASWAITTSVNSKRGVGVWSGRDTTTPIHRISGVARTSLGSPWNETSAAFSGGNTSIAGCDIAMIVDDDADLNGPCTHAQPGGFTKSVEHAGADVYSGVLYTKDGAGSGETGAYTGTGTIAGASADVSMVVLALAPAPGGGGSVTPNRGCMAMVADRMVKTIMLASAIHSVVGRHELRGAAQRSKVALPVVTRARITPPPTRTDTLPHVLKGATQRKPRLLPAVELTRKPLPITRPIVLPHMLKGAAAKKNRPFPEIALTRTPPPIARPFAGKHGFPVAAVTPIVVTDPTVAVVRTPLPRTLSFVAKSQAMGEERGPFPRVVAALTRVPLPRARSMTLRAAISHPTSGSGAPIVSMIETDQPLTRSFIGHRATLPPPPPAPSRARAVLAFFRTPRPVVESTIGNPLPRIVVSVPATSRARPVVALVRTPRPVTDSTVGTPLSRLVVTAPAASRLDPITALVRTPLARIKSFIGSLRPKQAQPAASRPRPRITFVRITPARTVAAAGSGVARGPAGLKLAIARSDATTRLSLATSATTAVQQNTATTPLGASQSVVTPLGWQNVATTPLNTSE